EALRRVARFYKADGKYNVAADKYTAAVAILRRLEKRGDRLVEAREALGQMLLDRGGAYADNGDLKEADTDYRDSRRLWAELLRTSGSQPHYQLFAQKCLELFRGLAGLYREQAWRRVKKDDWAGAAEACHRGIGLLQEILDAAPQTPGLRD